MRKVKTEAQVKTINNILGLAENANIQAYHNSNWNGEGYAFDGFTSNKYFTSDRPVVLDGNFRRADGKPLKGFGLEIETECWNVVGDVAYASVLKNCVLAVFQDDLFKLQHDGSLGGGGAQASAECITQVMTKEFIRNNYFRFKGMFQLFDVFGISASRTGNCGMHINISNACFGATENAQEQAIRKLYHFINKNFRLACALLRRDYRRTIYCSQMTQDGKTTPIERFTTGHGICFNWAHYNAGRIELRLVGGQKNYATFRNTMETVFFLIDACKRTPWEKMDDLEYLFKGCNNYVYDRLTLARNEGAITPEIVNAIADTVERVEYL